MIDIGMTWTVVLLVGSLLLIPAVIVADRVARWWADSVTAFIWRVRFRSLTYPLRWLKQALLRSGATR